MVNGVSIEEFNKLKMSLKVFKILTKAKFAAIEKDKQEYGEEDTESANGERSDKDAVDRSEEEAEEPENESSSEEDEQTTIGLKAFRELAKEVELIRK